MSLNTAHAPGGVLIFNGEFILLYCDGVDLQFEGQDSREFKGTKKGRIYLTTHRMVFTNKDTKDALQSFSFPFFTVTSLELEQPIFGANYIKGKVKAETNGNWTGNAIFKLRFMKGGAIEFGQAMMEAAKRASQFMSSEPPPYTPAPGPYYCPPPPQYMPPPGTQYGFAIPTHVFPDAPPANSVYMTDMPPPYPGVNSPPVYPTQGATAYPGAAPGYPPTGQGYPTSAPGYPPAGQGYSSSAPGYPPAGQGYSSSAPGYPPAAPGYPSAPNLNMQNAKAMEANQSAYYNPENPGYAYAPPAPGFMPANMPQGPPPPYSETSKKNN